MVVDARLFAVAGHQAQVRQDVIDDMRKMAKDKFDPSKVDLLLNELHPGSNMSVPDPWYGTEPGYHEAFALIEQACEIIIQKHLVNIEQGTRNVE